MSVPSILIPLAEVDVVGRETIDDEYTYPLSHELDFFARIYHSTSASEKVVMTFEKYYQDGDTALLTAIHRLLLQIEQAVIESMFSFVPSTLQGRNLYDRAVDLYSKMMKRIHPVRTIFVTYRLMK